MTQAPASCNRPTPSLPAVTVAQEQLRAMHIAYEMESDGVLVVRQTINLCSQQMERLPDFSMVRMEAGDFLCFRNNLSSLEGAPYYVAGNFVCDMNALTSLEGGPAYVGGDYSCEKNRLISLAGAPETIKDTFNCAANRLLTLDGAPQSVGNFICARNELHSLKGGPSSVDGCYHCLQNPLKSLEGLAETFKVLRSPFGDFCAPRDVPKKLFPITARAWAEVERVRIEAAIVAHTVLQQPIRISRPLSFKR